MPIHTSSRPLAVAALAFIAAFIASGCQDALTAPATTPAPVAPTAAAPSGQALSCTVDVRAHTLGCVTVAPAGSVAAHDAANDAGGPRRTLVLGGQGIYVKLTASATTYSGTTLTVPVAVQNLLSQPLGTTDGVSYDGRGVTVFFEQTPTTTGGSGTVTILNADTTGTYTAAAQPAFVYRQFLAGNQTSPEHDWQFSVPASVAGFQFLVYVRAQIPDESLPIARQPAHAFATTAAAGIVGGASHTCALRPDVGVYCWGVTTVPGSGGSMDASTSAVPLLVPGSAGAVALAPSVGAGHVCWLTRAGTAACVGDNSFGQLGDGSSTYGVTPRAVRMPAGVTAFSRLVAGIRHTCGLTGAGAVYCWGFNALGQLGDGTSNDDSSAVAVHMPVGVRFVALGAGELHTCGLTAAGGAYCWGYNGHGQLGNGTTTDAATPVPVQLPGGVTLTHITGGGTFTCGLAADGGAYCWGDNAAGQLGDGTTTTRGTPVRVQIPAGVTLTQIVTGVEHACGRASTGSVYCWGDGGAGQLGDGAFSGRLVPVAVPLPPGVLAAQLSAGGVGGGVGHSCAVTTTGAAYCWGSNAYGQIGDGTSGPGTDRGTPAAVRMP